MINLKRTTEWLRSRRQDLSGKVLQGGFWVFLMRVFNRGLGLLKTIVLARILAPEDFGLFGLAFLTLTALESFSEPGFDRALIQRQDDPRGYLDAGWSVQIIRGALLALVLFLGAPLVAQFFGRPEAIWVMRILGIGFLCESLRNIGIVYLRKELEFRTLFSYNFLSTFSEVAVAITAALITGSVWALVFGVLAGNISRLFLSYLLHSYRPRIRFRPEEYKELFQFGRWILGSSVLVFLINQGDDLFVGKVLGMGALGLYQMAYRFSNLPATEITHIISRVTFPAYSKLQENQEKLKTAYLQILQVTSLLSFPLAGGIAVLAPEFVTIFLGSKWMPMVPAMQILALWGMIRSIGATTGPLFMALDHPDYGTKLQFGKLIILVLIIYPLTIRWGIAGTSIAVVANAVVINPVADFLVIRELRCSVWKFLQMLVVPMFAVIVMVGGIAGLKVVIPQSFSLTAFTMFVLWGAILYLGTIAFVESISGYGLRTTLRRRFSSVTQSIDK